MAVYGNITVATVALKQFDVHNYYFFLVTPTVHVFSMKNIAVPEVVCVYDPWPRFPMLHTFSFFLGRKGRGT